MTEEKKETTTRLAPCGCHKTSKDALAVLEKLTGPMDQCIACAQKHMDQAWAAYFEYNYRNVNRRFIRAKLRAVVNHTYDRWPDIAKEARRLALLVQQGNDDDKAVDSLSDHIDKVFSEENPEVEERLNALENEHGKTGQ